ncbi:MAG: hypothetical protein GPJ52_01950 [Candidatus Heimdallarchaeota archaeon]|nr:hypothetical protein [Candidatus Heimdallarchaeota archaeon]
MSGIKINEIISEIRSCYISYLCASCNVRNVVMPFLVEGQVKYLCRECVNLVFDDKGKDEKKRALPFCVFCEKHSEGTVHVIFDRKRKVWQVWEVDKRNFKSKVVSEHQNFGDFILSELVNSRFLSIFKDITKKNQFTVFISKKEGKN